MVINETKLYKENIKDNPTLYRLLKENNKLTKITNLKLSDAGETKNFIFCFIFSLSYLMLNNKIEEIAPRTIKKLFSYILGELKALYSDADNKHKDFTNRLADNKFLELTNREDIAKERYFIYSDAKEIDYSTLESEFKTLEYNYYFYENELNEINLFITLFNSVKDIKPQNERTINRFLNDTLDIVSEYLKAPSLYNELDKSELKPKDTKYEINIIRNENLDNIFNLGVVNINNDSKGLAIIQNYKENVEDRIINLRDKINKNASHEEVEKISASIEDASKNIIEDYGRYYLIDSENFNTVVNVIGIRGLYFVTNKEGEKIARIPSSIIVSKSDALYILDKLVLIALKDINNPSYEIELNNREIAILTNCLEEYEELEQNIYNEDSKEYHSAYDKVKYSKKDFINKITEQLSYIRLEVAGLKGDILNYREIGNNFENGIKIIFSKQYLYLRLYEGMTAQFNASVLELFKDNIYGVKIYEGILKEILKNEILKTGEYNYIFSLKQIRAFSGYASKEFIEENLQDGKQKNKNIRDLIKRDLYKLKKANYIYISKLKDKRDFTIMLKNKKPIELAKDIFIKQCEKNGHEIDEEN